jgi:hypothetical protein
VATSDPDFYLLYAIWTKREPVGSARKHFPLQLRARGGSARLRNNSAVAVRAGANILGIGPIQIHANPMRSASWRFIQRK